MDDASLHELADRLFQLFVDHDFDGVGAMLAPEATLTQNGNTSTYAEARPMLEGITAVIGDHRYENVRRVIGDRAVVEEHDVVSTTPEGRSLRLFACVVIRVDDDGRVVSLDEYVDPTPLA